MLRPRRALALGVLALALLGSAVNATASPITVSYVDPVTNWEWAEVADLTGLSWHQVHGICADDGVTACAGTLAGKEFDGWTWATATHVRDLFVNATNPINAVQLIDIRQEF